MAIERFCDYCGQLIDGQFATIESGGYPSPTWIRETHFHFCAGTRDDHDESCFQMACVALLEMKRWAHRDEGSPLEWTLTERAALAVGDSDDPGEKVAEPVARPVKPIKGELRISRWIKHPGAQSALNSGGVRTLEEAAELTEYDIEALPGVGSRTVGRLKEAMAEQGLCLQTGATSEFVGARIRELRETQGMRRGELASAISQARGSVCGERIGAWESGRKPCPREWLVKIAEFFCVPIESFLQTGVA